MRWGVRDEMTNEHMTTELCMRELVSCQKLSIGIVIGNGMEMGNRMEQILIVLVQGPTSSISVDRSTATGLFQQSWILQNSNC